MYIFIAIAVGLVLSAYPIYAVVVWNLSKSPDSFSKFPTSGTWVCETDDFSITMNLDDVGESKYFENAKVTISFDENTYELGIYVQHGHGTPLAPTRPSQTLNFRCTNEDCYTNFSTSKYKINDNDFYLLNIYVSKNNKLEFLHNGMDLHFVKSEVI